LIRLIMLDHCLGEDLTADVHRRSIF
jgi:hypothetical protein